MLAWFVAKVATLASVSRRPAPIALQYFYSLANRDIEEELVPLAAEFQMALQPWSPLAFGLLTGKYDRRTVEAAAPRSGGLPRNAGSLDAARPDNDKRLDGANPFGDSLFTERNWKIVEALRRVSQECGEPAARVALAWVIGRPGVCSTLVGVSRLEQLHDNFAALGTRLSDAHREQLVDVVSAPEQKMLYQLFAPSARQHVVFGGGAVQSWAERSSARRGPG